MSINELRTTPIHPHTRPALAMPWELGGAVPALMASLAFFAKMIAKIAQGIPMMPYPMHVTIEMMPSTIDAIALPLV